MVICNTNSGMFDCLFYVRPTYFLRLVLMSDDMSLDVAIITWPLL